MVKLDYIIDKIGLRDGEDFLSAPQEHLHYYFFLGDVTFIVDGVDFSARWGWVPILDFAVTLSEVISELAENPYGLFEFTESGDTIDFLLDDDRVKVSCTYVNEIAIVDYSILREQARSFAVRVLMELGDAHPLLKKNQHFSVLEKEFISEKIYDLSN